jgi:hypothetical protein
LISLLRYHRHFNSLFIFCNMQWYYFSSPNQFPFFFAILMDVFWLLTSFGIAEHWLLSRHTWPRLLSMQLQCPLFLIMYVIVYCQLFNFLHVFIFILIILLSNASNIDSPLFYSSAWKTYWVFFHLFGTYILFHPFYDFLYSLPCIFCRWLLEVVRTQHMWQLLIIVLENLKPSSMIR